MNDGYGSKLNYLNLNLKRNHMMHSNYIELLYSDFFILTRKEKSRIIYSRFAWYYYKYYIQLYSLRYLYLLNQMAKP